MASPLLQRLVEGEGAMEMGAIMRRLVVVSGLVGLAGAASACVGEDPGPSDGGESNLTRESEQKDIDIHAVRNPGAPDHPAYGTKLSVSGIVTGVKNAGATHGFFVQDPGEPAWGAIYIYAGAAKIDLQPGTVVRATGYYTSFRGLDEIDVTNGAIERTGTAPVPAPLEVAVAEIANGGARAAELQSVSLLVTGVTATRATTGIDFSVRSAKDAAELVVTSYWANDTGTSPFPASINQRYASIRGFGIRFGANDAATVAKLAPIAPTDVVAE
jgi:hypothetical protein